MTVAELIAALREYPGDTRVVVDGHGYGYDDAAAPRALPIAVNANSPDEVGGRHGDGDAHDEGAVLIGPNY